MKRELEDIMPLKESMELLDHFVKELNEKGWDREIHFSSGARDITVAVYSPATPSDDATLPEGALRFARGGYSGRPRLHVRCPVCTAPVE